MLAWFPVDVELSLLGSVSQPVEPHVHGFGSLLFDSVIDYSLGCTVISLDRCSWLGMSKFLEALSHWQELLCIGIEDT